MSMRITNDNPLEFVRECVRTVAWDVAFNEMRLQQCYQQDKAIRQFMAQLAPDLDFDAVDPDLFVDDDDYIPKNTTDYLTQLIAEHKSSLRYYETQMPLQATRVGYVKTVLARGLFPELNFEEIYAAEAKRMRES